MNKQIYLIGDVHGCYDTLIALIAQLPENAKIIFCGDLIDRGPKSKQVINFVRENGHYCVMGNHEDMMIQFCESSYNSSYWFKNGGRACFNNYDNDDELMSDVQWIKNLPRLIILNGYVDKMGRSLVVSHAPVVDYLDYYLHIREKIENNEYTEHELIEFEHTIANSEELMIWNRNIPKKENTKYFNVFGHNPIDSFIFDKDRNYTIDPKNITESGIVVDILKGYANIDTGACYKSDCYSKYRGRLTALEFPSMKVFQQENIDVYE